MYPSTHSIKFVAFYMLHSTYFRSSPSHFQHARGLRLGHPASPPLEVRPVGQEQPALVLMNIAEYDLELLCVTLIHRAR